MEKIGLICPFMSRTLAVFSDKDLTDREDSTLIYCQKEKCMAWGTWTVGVGEVNEKGYQQYGKMVEGCKLIDKK